jgi:hypothetical protein
MRLVDWAIDSTEENTIVIAKSQIKGKGRLVSYRHALIEVILPLQILELKMLLNFKGL